MITGRFTPDEATLREMVVAANERAERLALRIVAAEHAVKSGQSATVVLALLGGAEDE